MIVVDASVVFKWIRDEEDFHDIAQSIYRKIITNQLKIIGPDFLNIEITNVIVTKSSIDSKLISELLQDFLALPIKYIPITPSLLKVSAMLAKKYKTSVYDMLYAVIAKRNKCKLITADRKFIEKTKFSHVIHISEYK